MLRFSRNALVLIACTTSAALAEPPAPKKKAGQSKAPVAIRDAELAARSIQVPDGMRLGLFAIEPMVGNPVALAIDERGRVYVAETFRLYRGVTDTRRHMNWLNDDMASRTVDDRVAMFRKYLSAQEFGGYRGVSDQVRLVEDTDGDGKADRASVFADGFDQVPDGPAAGVVARHGATSITPASPTSGGSATRTATARPTFAPRSITAMACTSASSVTTCTGSGSALMANSTSASATAA